MNLILQTTEETSSNCLALLLLKITILPHPQPSSRQQHHTRVQDIQNAK